MLLISHSILLTIDRLADLFTWDRRRGERGLQTWFICDILEASWLKIIITALRLVAALVLEHGRFSLGRFEECAILHRLDGCMCKSRLFFVGQVDVGFVGLEVRLTAFFFVVGMSIASRGPFPRFVAMSFWGWHSSMRRIIIWWLVRISLHQPCKILLFQHFPKITTKSIESSQNEIISN